VKAASKSGEAGPREIKTEAKNKRKEIKYARTYNNMPILDAPDTTQSAFKNGATVSTRLMPGETLTATMLDLWDARGTTGIAFCAEEVGRAGAVGRESRMRWRCRVRTVVRSARAPSRRKSEVGGKVDLGILFRFVGAGGEKAEKEERRAGDDAAAA
jgi:hypothetical protein